MLLRGDTELVQRLLKIVHERVPFGASNFHVFVRLVHGASGVFLRAAGGPADHFRDKVFESWRGHAMVRFIHAGIRGQSWVDHDAVNEVIDDGGDGAEAAEALVKGGGLCPKIRSY